MVGVAAFGIYLTIPSERSDVCSCGKSGLGGATAWTKRNKKGGEFMAVKKPAKKKKAARKFKGVRREKS